jgi:hypothetical protein
MVVVGLRFGRIRQGAGGVLRKTLLHGACQVGVVTLQPLSLLGSSTVSFFSEAIRKRVEMVTQ